MTPEEFQGRVSEEGAGLGMQPTFFVERTMNPDDPSDATLTAAWNRKGRVRLFSMGDWWFVRGYRMDDKSLGGTVFIPSEFADVAQPDHRVSDDVVADAVRHVLR